MLSISTAAEPAIQKILWQGQNVDVYAGHWIVGVAESGIESLAAIGTGGVGTAATARAELGQAFSSLATQTVEGWLSHSGIGQSLQLLRNLGSDGSERLFELQSAIDAGADVIRSAISQLPGFRYIEPDFVLSTTTTTPNDPLYSTLYGMNNTGQTGGVADADIDAPEAWDLSTGSKDVVVGVIDTGVDYTHPDLAANIWTNPGEIPGDGIDNDNNGFVDDIHGWDFANDDNDPMDDNNHGTHVSGTIGGVGNNGVGVVGVNWNVQIMALKYLGADGHGSTSNAVDALNYATMMRRDHGINIRLTSNSWGGGGFSQSLYNAIAASGDQDMLFIAAAGNGGNDGVGDDNDSIPFYPASYDLDNIISVAATNSSDQKAGFSNFGSSTVDLGAPGVSVRSTIPGNAYAYFNGTSMATPHVAGVAALAWSVAPTANYQTIRDAIFAGVDPIPSMDGITVTGGRLNAFGTLEQLGMRVISTFPAKGSVITTLPTDFAINLSNPYVAGTVDASDLTVNGTPADSFTLTDADTITFHFNSSPIVGQGLQTIALADGAITRSSDSSPLHAYSGTFRFDALPMAVASTVPTNATTASLPLTAITVVFNEAYDPSSVGINDLSLSQGTVTGFSLQPDSVTYNVSGLSNEGVMSLNIAAGALTDLYGNPIVAYAGSITLDYGVFPLPTLTSVAPQGSQVYDPPISGSIGFVGDTDSFTLNLVAGQVVSVFADPAAGLRPTLELRDPASALLATVTASAAGKDAVLQTVAAPTTGTYTITISGSSATTGSYSLTTVLNAAVEMESHDGPTADDTFGTAQDLNSGFISLGAGATQAAIIGRTDALQNPALPAEVESNNTTGTANTAIYNFATYSSNFYQLSASGSITSGDVDWYAIGALQVGDVISVSVGGSASSRGTLTNPAVDLYRNNSGAATLVTSDDDSGPGSDPLINRFTITTGDTYFIRVRATSGTGTYQMAAWLENSSTAPSTGGSLTSETESNNTAATANDASTSWRAVGYRSDTTATITSGDSDFYKYTFTAGDLVTVIADSTSTMDARVALLNSGGTVIAAEDGTSTGPGVDSPIYGYRIPTTGTYYVRVQARLNTGNYNADVYLSTTTPPPTPTVPPDWYAFSLNAGDRATLVLKSLSTGTIHVALADTTGTDIALGATGATNADELIHQFVASNSGTYYAHVTGAANVDYNLLVLRGSDFDTEANNSPGGTLVDLTNVHNAAGYLDHDRPAFTSPVAFTIDSTQSIVTISGDLQGIPFDEQTPGSLTTHYAGSLNAMVQSGTVQFTGGSAVDAIAHPGPFQPGNVSADYAGQVVVSPTLTAYGVFQNLVMNPTSGVLPVDGSGQFDPTKLSVAITTGMLNYAIGALASGSYDLSGTVVANQTDQQATLIENNGVLYLTIPVYGADSIIEPDSGLQFNLQLTGTIVASLVLPPPIDPDDYYQVTLAAGERLTVATHTPLDGSTPAELNTLNPDIELLDATNAVVASDANSAGDGKNASLQFISATGGTFKIHVHSTSGSGEYFLTTAIDTPDIVAPKVTGLEVAGTGWAPGYLSHLQTASLGDGNGYAIPVGSAAQSTPLSWVNVNQVQVTFSEDVIVSQSSLVISGVNAPSYAITGFNYQVGSHTATWTLNSAIDVDRVTLKLASSGPAAVTDTSSNPLDGEWINNLSAYPSGDNTAGGDFEMTLNVLPADVNVDGIVNGLDIALVASHWLHAGDFAGDTNGDDVVNGLDIAAIASHWLKTLPAGPGGGSGSSAASAMAAPTDAPTSLRAPAAASSVAVVARSSATTIAAQTLVADSPSTRTGQTPEHIAASVADPSTGTRTGCGQDSTVPTNAPDRNNRADGWRGGSSSAGQGNHRDCDSSSLPVDDSALDTIARHHVGRSRTKLGR